MKKYLSVILVLVGFFIFVVASKDKNNIEKALTSSFAQETNNANIDKTVFISGSIGEVKSDCSSDGICKVKVGKYWVLTDTGGDPNPGMEELGEVKGGMYKENGERAGNIAYEGIVGKKAEVYAKKVEADELSLYGSRDYYIKLLP